MKHPITSHPFYERATRPVVPVVVSLLRLFLFMRGEARSALTSEGADAARRFATRAPVIEIRRYLERNEQ
jgi:hypothetical protein